MSRKYEMRRRAEKRDATRLLIVEAAVELHNEIGPAHTTDQAIAERAGVTRRTFYRHFPDEMALFAACTRHGLEKWPPPDPDALSRLADPLARLNIGLRRLYAYFREVGPGLLVTRRDSSLLDPAVRALPSRAQVLAAIPVVLDEGWQVAPARRPGLSAALRLATSVATWSELVQVGGLGDEEAVRLLVSLVLTAAGYERVPPEHEA